VTTTGIGLKIQMLKLYLVEEKCSMWYMMLGTAICNCMVTHKSVSHSKATDLLTFRLLLMKGVRGEQGLIVSHPVYNFPSVDPLHKTQ